MVYTDFLFYLFKLYACVFLLLLLLSFVFKYFFLPAQILIQTTKKSTKSKWFLSNIFGNIGAQTHKCEQMWIYWKTEKKINSSFTYTFFFYFIMNTILFFLFSFTDIIETIKRAGIFIRYYHIIWSSSSSIDVNCGKFIDREWKRNAFELFTLFFGTFSMIMFHNHDQMFIIIIINIPYTTIYWYYRFD